MVTAQRIVLVLVVVSVSGVRTADDEYEYDDEHDWSCYHKRPCFWAR